MRDYEMIEPSNEEGYEQKKSKDERRKVKKNRSRKQRDKYETLSDRDDLSGMMLNMIGKVDIREIVILWIVFILLHSSPFVDGVLKRFKGTTDEKGGMTMKGTAYASLFMILAVIVCTLAF